MAWAGDGGGPYSQAQAESHHGEGGVCNGDLARGKALRMHTALIVLGEDVVLARMALEARKQSIASQLIRRSANSRCMPKSAPALPRILVAKGL